ncbi:MAG: M48 family metalloprotease [Halofilum sp. (in: g-proteobacteria)]|nr:M48 family metalloprotease [Halofilum sp. (in: g-proteobacteria)]
MRHLAAAALAGAAATATAGVELPSMGSPVDQVLSPREEAAIGAEMMARARQQLELNRDPEIAAYFDALGGRLAAGVDNAPPGGFQFFIVHDARINAFAAPGGYIGLNSGLFLAAENEGQLAGVVAHEIAHVTQRHIAKAYAANQRSQYTTLATVLAALILGSQNPEAAEAAITTGVAAQAQRQINYTRANEYEADRIGIGILAEAGYDPAGMAGMFELLMASAGSSADAVPEFLRTHPLSSNRVAEAESRAAGMATSGMRNDSLEFHLMQRRLRVIDADEPRVLHSRWAAESPQAGTHAGAAHAYGLALLERRTGAAAEAAARLERLRSDARQPPLRAGAGARLP